MRLGACYAGERQWVNCQFGKEAHDEEVVVMATVPGIADCYFSGN